MAIVKKVLNENEAGEEIKISLEIDNGDLDAMHNIMDQYSFVDEQALLRYALVSLLQADDNILYVKKGDNMASVKISGELVKPKNSEE